MTARSGIADRQGNLRTIVEAIFAAKRNGFDRESGFATEKALAALDSSDVRSCLTYLEYAQRLAPSDTAISFALGEMRIVAGDPRAVEPLELVAERTGWRDAIVHLAIARRHFGDSDGAAAELHRTLAVNAPGTDGAFRTIATGLADETGAPGWCGVDNSGYLTLGGGVVRAAWRDLAFALDGEAIAKLAKPRARGRVLRLALPEGWNRARHVTVTWRDRPLIGSPVQIQQVTRVEGFVAVTSQGLVGWCWLPGEREFAPPVLVRSSAEPERSLRLVAEALYDGAGEFPDFAAPRGFTAHLDDLVDLPGPLEVRGPFGRVLYGSPVDPAARIGSAERAAAAVATLYPAIGEAEEVVVPPMAVALREPSIPVEAVGRRRNHPKPALPRPVDIVVPVYRGLGVTMACIESVVAARSLPDERIVVVVDASPDTELIAQLKTLAAQGIIKLSLQDRNRGFPATANIGMRMSEGRDVILLNSDTLTPPGWAARLQAAAYAADDIGTATPLSNDATIFSYPANDVANPLPDLDEVRALATMAAEANGDAIIDVPTGHGFCMYVRQECLGDAGLLREDVFGQGYGEENDFCMRARVLGWRHVAVPGLFVGHVGSQSFAATKTHLIRRNLEILNRLHVGYDRLIQDWLVEDPLAGYRRNLDGIRLRTEIGNRRSVVLVTHDRQGGVYRHVRERMVRHENAGDCAIMLRPDRDRAGSRLCRIETLDAGACPNLVFRLPDESGLLVEFLRAIQAHYVEFHHFIGHHESVFELVGSVGQPYDVFIHDYSWFCPRVTLTGGDNRYCGEPASDVCATCVADHGSNIDEAIEPEALRARSAAFLRGARSVVAPSYDTARRIGRQLDIPTLVGLWETESPLRIEPIVPTTGGRRKLCVVGAIGHEKGYDTLLELARHVSRYTLPLEIAIVGYTCDDARLFATGCVTITGRYEESEAVGLIRAQNADFGFLPALWPETWSYTLSQMWEANLPVIAYDIGAPAERIQSRGGGFLIPLHLPVEKLVTFFLDGRLFGAASLVA
ncbi:MAG TPA: glycosyltransferase [Acidiphilium sp.]